MSGWPLTEMGMTTWAHSVRGVGGGGGRQDQELTRLSMFESHSKNRLWGAGAWSPWYHDLDRNRPLRAIPWHLTP